MHTVRSIFLILYHLCSISLFTYFGITRQFTSIDSIVRVLPALTELLIYYQFAASMAVTFNIQFYDGFSQVLRLRELCFSHTHTQ